MRPKKSYGQNFLQDSQVVEQIIAAATIKKTDSVVEIGPGLGALTFPLSEIAARVIAIEADLELADRLRRKVAPNVTVITGNALEIDWTIELDDYLIVANLPYSITSPFLRRCLALENRPTVMVLTVQKEVGERLLAPPGDSNRGFISLLCQAQTTIEKICLVPPTAFWPKPGVDSIVVRLTFNQTDLTPTIYWPLVEAGFRHKRQMLINALVRNLARSKQELGSIFQTIGVSSAARPSDLTLANWQELSRYFIDQR